MLGPQFHYAIASKHASTRCRDDPPFACVEAGCPSPTVSCFTLRPFCENKFSEIWKQLPFADDAFVWEHCRRTCRRCQPTVAETQLARVSSAVRRLRSQQYDAPEKLAQLIDRKLLPAMDCGAFCDDIAAFRRADKDGSGKLDLEEFQQVVREMNLTDKDAKALFAIADDDRSGTLSIYVRVRRQ